MRLPKPLEYLANAKRGRYILSGTAVFAHRGEEWAERITAAVERAEGPYRLIPEKVAAKRREHDDKSKYPRDRIA